MSRIGKKIVVVPAGVKVTYEAPLVKVTGPKGNLSQRIDGEVVIHIEKEKVWVDPPEDPKKGKALYGLTRTLIANMVTGVSKGFERVLEINGVGYRAELQGNALNFSLGYSHPVQFALPEGVKATVDRSNVVRLEGIDIEVLGETAARIRALRPVEPYKGKGVRYSGERVHRKVGKTGSKK